VVEEDGAWSVLFPGYPLSREGSSFQKPSTTPSRSCASTQRTGWTTSATPPTLGQLGVRPVHPAVVRRRTLGLAQRVLGRMRWPAPTRAAHDQFCRNEGWTVRAQRTGKKNVHHITYELALPGRDGPPHPHSRPPDRSNYGASMWRTSCGTSCRRRSFLLGLRERPGWPPTAVALRNEGKLFPWRSSSSC